MKNAFLFIGLVLSLVACTVESVPRAASTYTPIPSPSTTHRPTRTPTPSLTLRPSMTPEPTETSTASISATPEPTLSLTPTVPASSPSPTPTARSALDCKLVWQSPGNGANYLPDQAFTAGWKVSNNGTSTWDVNSVDFVYLGGAKLYDYPLVHLKTSVSPGQSVILSVRMRAPKNSTKYVTYWSMRRGDTFFCRVMLSIYVE